MGKSDGGLLRYRLGSASDQESGAQGQNSWLELYSAFFFRTKSQFTNLHARVN